MPGRRRGEECKHLMNPFLSALLLGLALLAALPAQACELRVRRHPDPLMLVRLPSGELTGPQLETVREALRRVGCRVVVLDLPWARALSDLADGRLDVLPGAHRRPERDTLAWFSASSWPSRNRLFMRSADLREEAPASLQAFGERRLRLGLQVGVGYGTDIDRWLQRPDHAALVVRAPSRQGLWQMLARGRIDGLLADERTGEIELERLGLRLQVQASAIVLEAEPSHTAFSRMTVSPELVARYDAAMDAMHRDGTQAAILRRFQPLMALRPRP